MDVSAWNFTLEVKRPNGTVLNTLTNGDGIEFLTDSKVDYFAPGSIVASWPQEMDLIWTMKATAGISNYTLIIGRILVSLKGGDCCEAGIPEFTVQIENNITFDFNLAVQAGGETSTTPINIVNGSTLNIPAETRLIGIDFYAANVSRTFSIGTSANGTDIADNEDIPANQTYSYDRVYFFETSGTLHFSGDPAKIKVYLKQ